jgi:DNA-binding transcriptional MerR regulator
MLPEKHNFKIGEVVRITGIKAHVLRYWESEFPQLQPQKTASNQRIYSRRDVEQILLIQQLVHHQGFTIAGARRRLRELVRGSREQERRALASLVGELRDEVNRLLAVLDEP